MKALEKDRARRYASAAELAADVRRHLAHEPVSAARPGATYRLRKFVRRNRVLVAAATCVGLALTAGGVTSSILYIRTLQQRDELVQRLADVRDAASALGEFAEHRATNVAGASALRYELAARGVDFAKLFSARSVPLRDPVSKRVPWLAARVAYAYQRVGEAEQAVTGNLRAALASHSEALKVREEQLAAQPDSAGALRELAVSRWKMAEVQSEMGQFDRALDSNLRALEIFRGMARRKLDEVGTGGAPPENWDNYLLMALQRTGETLMTAGDARGASDAFSQALDHYEFILDCRKSRSKLTLPEHRAAVECLRGLAETDIADGRPQDAHSKLDRALEILQHLAERTGPNNVWERTHEARCWISRADAAAALGRPAEALEHARRAAGLAEALRAADPAYFESAHLLGRCSAELAARLLDVGELSSAADTARRAVDVLNGLARATPSETTHVLLLRDRAWALGVLGRVYGALAVRAGDTGDTPSARDEHRNLAESYLTRSVAEFGALQQRGVLAPPDLPLLFQARAARAESSDAPE
jgi:tetratricopeptide (TPR) repeat protein